MTERDYVERATQAPDTTAILEKSGTEEVAARHPFLGVARKLISKSGRFCTPRDRKPQVRENVSAPGRIRTCDRENGEQAEVIRHRGPWRSIEAVEFATAYYAQMRAQQPAGVIIWDSLRTMQGFTQPRVSRSLVNTP